MKTPALWAAAAAAGITFWAASPELAWPARLFAAILLGPAPLAAMLQARAADTLPRPIPRVRFYLSSIAGLFVMALLAYLAANRSGYSQRVTGLELIGAGSFVVWTVFALFACAAIVAAFKAGGLREVEMMRDLVPHSAKEKSWFVALSLAAGICEEFSFRGFLLPTLAYATGSVAAGVLLSSLAFGIMHAHQKAGGAARAAVLGAVLAVPLLMTGSILPSIAAHAAVDIIGGIFVPRWLFR